MKNEKYEIETIEDIANCISISNIENFLEGFGQGLRAYLTAIALTRQAMREQGRDDINLKNSEIVHIKNWLILMMENRKMKSTY